MPMTTGKKVLIGCSVALGVVVIMVGIIIAIAFWATSGITDVAKQQLSALKAGDLDTAYSLTSNDFRRNVTKDQFQQFVDAYPALKNNVDQTFTTRSTENDTGTLKGTLKAEDGTVTPVTYTLVKENDEWKILNINLNPDQSDAGTNDSAVSNTTDTQAEGAKVVNVLLNDTADEQGTVKEGKSTFATDTEKIAVSVYVQGAKTGDQVGAKLTYEDTGDSIGPAINDIKQDGDLISNFEFTKPTAGWPKGKYRLDVALKSGDGGSIEITVE